MPEDVAIVVDEAIIETFMDRVMGDYAGETRPFFMGAIR